MAPWAAARLARPCSLRFIFIRYSFSKTHFDIMILLDMQATSLSFECTLLGRITICRERCCCLEISCQLSWQRYTLQYRLTAVKIIFSYFCILFPIFVLVYQPLSPGGNPITVNKYLIVSYIIISSCFNIKVVVCLRTVPLP